MNHQRHARRFRVIIKEETAKRIGIREYVMKPVLRNKPANTVRKVFDGS